MAPRRVLFAFATLGLVALGLPLALATPAGAATDDPIATWNMNEGAGASVMSDSSGNGLTGAIGSDITTGITYDGATGYRFPYATPNTPPTLPNHTVVVPNSSQLNPGTDDFAVTIRYRTTHSFGNIIQKGQSSAAGGYFKFENPGGTPTCLFRGLSGSRGASAGSDLSDGAWHTIRCERTEAGVKMWVDGVLVGNVLGATGSISNDRPISIAGKLNCDQIEVTCDYFSGDIDYVTIEGPGTVTDTTAPSTPAKPSVASPSSGRAVVTWPASTDNMATTLTYSVFRDGGSTAVGTVTGGTTGTISFTENGLEPGASHSYRIRASDGTNTSPLSPRSDDLTIAGQVADTTPPSTPAKPNVASPSSGRAVVTWPASTDNVATSLTYSVFRDGGSTAVGTVTGGTTGTISFTENGLEPGASHSYRIRASDGSNTSALSPRSDDLTIAGQVTDTTAPSIPGKPSVASPLPGRAVITWPASTDNMATTLTYTVYRNGGPTPIGTVTGGTTGTFSFTENGLPAGSAHTYRVRASDGTNISGLSPLSPALVINSGPTGTVNPITVDGKRISVTGRASDADGAPIVRVESVIDGRKSRRDRPTSGGAYSVVWDDLAGTHSVCVSVLDTPSGTPTLLGCSDVVVK